LLLEQLIGHRQRPSAAAHAVVGRGGQRPGHCPRPSFLGAPAGPCLILGLSRNEPGDGDLNAAMCRILDPARAGPAGTGSRQKNRLRGNS
jgi:hypothetical protein